MTLLASKPYRCHQGHEHANSREVTECNELEEKIQRMRTEPQLRNCALDKQSPIEMVELSRMKLSTEEIQSDCEDCLETTLPLDNLAG